MFLEAGVCDFGRLVLSRRLRIGLLGRFTALGAVR